MNIQEQIEALTQELRPCPVNNDFWYFDPIAGICDTKNLGTFERMLMWKSPSSSTNKAEVEEYADCYRRLKLYQLIGEKKKKEFSLNRVADSPIYGTDFLYYIDLGVADRFSGRVTKPNWKRHCVLGGVWFANESDRLHALSICRIDRSFQEKCARFGLGGA
mgnify:CR=1 FL=1